MGDSETGEAPLSPIVDGFSEDFGLPTGFTPEISSVADDSTGPLSPLLFDVAANPSHPEVDMFYFEVQAPVSADAVVPAQEALTSEADLAAQIELPELPTVKKRKKQVRVPDSKRDEKYKAYRAKNTAKAKAIRDRKRVEKQMKIERLNTVLARSAELRAEVERLELMFSQVKAAADARGLVV